MPHDDLPDIQQELGELGQEKLFGFSCNRESITFEVFSGGGTDKSCFELVVRGDITRKVTLVRIKVEKREAFQSRKISYLINEIEPALTVGLFTVGNPFTAVNK